MTVLWSFMALYWLQLVPYVIADFANGVVEKESAILCIISYLGVKSWDLQVCDRASTITHVDREKKNSANYNNKMFYFFLG